MFELQNVRNDALKPLKLIIVVNRRWKVMLYCVSSNSHCASFLLDLAFFVRHIWLLMSALEEVLLARMSAGSFN